MNIILLIQITQAKGTTQIVTPPTGGNEGGIQQQVAN